MPHFSAEKQRHSDLSRETKEQEDSLTSLKADTYSYFYVVHPIVYWKIATELISEEVRLIRT